MSDALLIIDMQNFVLERIQRGVNYYPTNCIENMQIILAKFRDAGKPVLHVRHHSVEADSLLHQDSSQAQVISLFAELPGEPVFIKNTSSAFSSSSLLSHLKIKELSRLTVVGAVAGFCVSSTVRMGSDLGFEMRVVKDAVISFDLEGTQVRALDIYNVTLALLESDFAHLVETDDLQLTE